MSDQERVNLIYMVESENISISKASSILGLNYNNAMAIIRTYRKENKAESNRSTKHMTVDSRRKSEVLELFASLGGQQLKP